jgi:preprotein translocase subunit SecF
VAGIIGRLYRGETSFDFIGSRRRWYLASAILLLVCVISFGVRGFNFGIDFKGGTQFQFSAPPNVSTEEVTKVVEDAGAQTGAAPQVVGSGSTRQIVVKTGELSGAEEKKVKQALANRYHLHEEDVSVSSVSSSWGSDITKKAIKALGVFLVLVCIFIAVRFEPKMAIAAILALIHDLIVAAGIYSLVGFEVTPSTVVGLLTILGFSLYDTVVVFDKVAENARGILGGSRMTYSEAANLAVNQTLARSINTSLIALLPVAGLLFVGAGLLGVGTIKDLALVLFVGLASGAYSSLFLATPILCDLKEREPQYAALRKRVAAKRVATVSRAATASQPRTATATGPGEEEVEAAPAGEPEPATAGATAGERRGSGGSGGSTPRPGARPKRPQQQRRGGGGRPSAKRRR